MNEHTSDGFGHDADDTADYERLVDLIRRAPESDANDIVSTVVLKFGAQLVERHAARLRPAGSTATNPFICGSVRASDLKANPQPLTAQWFGIYPGKVTLFIGETGAGKSSLLYNIAIHAARNEPLWFIAFGVLRPLRVLYIDPENAGNFAHGEGGLCAVKVNRIGMGRPETLTFHDGSGVNLSTPAHIEQLRAWIEEEEFDLVILDPIANLFGTKDENDNAEAARQMAPLIELARSTGAAILIVHHTGKGEPTGNYGRGASARLGACDVGIMVRAKGTGTEQDDTYRGETIPRNDLVRIQIVKNRIDGKASVYLRMAGEDKFETATYADWVNSADKTDRPPPKSERAQQDIRLMLADGAWYERQAIIAKMEAEGHSRSAIGEALKQMVTAGEINRKGKAGRGIKQEFRLAPALPSNEQPETPAECA